VVHGALFTRDYLGEAIVTSEPWQSLDDGTVSAFRDSVLAVYRSFPTTRRPNEAVTEDDLIWKVLSLLGWHHALRQINLSPKGMDHKPDGILFADESAKERANARSEEWKRYADGVAIVESKRWLRELDRKSSNGDDLGVPSAQMIRYLDRVNIVTNATVRWGILTNGRHWRLYYHGATSVAEEFLELDLPALVGVPGIEPDPFGGDPVHELKLFMVLFGPAAFRPGTDGRTFHQVARDEGRQWEQRVTRNLSDLVFDRVFPVLVKGIVAHDPDRPGLITQDYLNEVRDAALILLYRLLFVLYAEDRNLLPARHRAYEEYGMRKRVREDIRKRVDGQDVFMAEGGEYYPHLLRLFRRIDKGAPSVGLPPYNGGLFAAGRYGARILDRLELPDSLFAPMVDALSRDDDGGQKKWINYRDLSVQHLGSIYERLLENEVRLQDGEVVVGGDGGARHSSGSFYTPEAPVQLILSQAVGPLLRDRLEAFRRKAEALASDTRPKPDRLADLERLDPATRMLEIKVCDPAMGSGHFLVSLVDYLADRVLAAIADAEATVTWAKYNSPLIETIVGIREGILAHGRAGKWTIEEHQLEDRLIVRRMILKRVIYGVDKNPMAVELAKLALWLHTFTVGAPLSFLEHHLRCGDSICGEWIFTVEEHLKKIGATMFLGQSVARARLTAQGMAKIERLVDADVAEVKLSQDTFETVKEATGPLNCFLDFIQARRWIEADVAAARVACAEALADRNAILSPEKYVETAFLGVLAKDYGDPIDIAVGTVTIPPGSNGRTPDAYPKPTRGKAHDYIPAAIQEVARELVARAREVAAQERFLHWQVAFPGVWEDWESIAPRGGFDAVIGNPPYVRQELLSRAKPALRDAYAAFDGAADLYVYFYELGLKILKPGGRLSYIVTNKWMKAGYAEALRTLFVESAWVEGLVDFGHARQIFPDADVFPCVVTVRKPLPDPEPAPLTTRVCVIERTRLDLDKLIQQVDDASFPMPRDALTPTGWNLEPPEVLALMEKIRKAGVRLKEYIGAEPLYGLKTGFNDAFLIDQPTRDRLVSQDGRLADIIRPYLRGQDIERWAPAWDRLWMIVLKSSANHPWPWADATTEAAAETCFRTTYPVLHTHVRQFERDLRARTDQGRFWWEFRACAYYDKFDRPKIMYQDITWNLRFCLDASNTLSNNTVFCLPTNDLWVLAVLNAPIGWWFSWRAAQHGKDDALRYLIVFIKEYPIPIPDSDVRDKVTEAVSRLIAITKNLAGTTATILDWLRLEYDVIKPNQRLQAPVILSLDDFLTEVKKNRKGRLTPAAIAALKQGYADTLVPARALSVEAANLERVVSTLVNRAYGVTPEEEALMWRTAPPRMPIGSPMT
jgi:hypothetical protein